MGEVVTLLIQRIYFQKNIDGGLIGGASLNSQSFVDIINSF